MADVELVHPRDPGHRDDVAVGEPVAGVEHHSRGPRPGPRVGERLQAGGPVGLGAGLGVGAGVEFDRLHAERGRRVDNITRQFEATIGEIVQTLPHEPIDITLVIPPFGVSTPLVYKTWDAIGSPRHEGSAHGANDLEPAALVAEPRLVRVRDRITDAAGTRPLLAGSGSTWFLRGHFDWLAEALPDSTVVLTHTVDRA
mgnify:CR=1 FL=1